MLNVYFGGSLYQDHRLRPGRTDRHSGEDIPTGDRHDVTIDPGSWLAGAIDKPRITVNSIHHQSVDRLAGGFAVTATADDGVIEAIEYTGPGLVVAVQWHPEMISADDPYAQGIFRRFIQRSR